MVTDDEQNKALTTAPIKIAILAMGGEGGGVLANWIIDLAENNGYLGHSTSVPGVAQRTGATIYYVELFPQADIGAQTPVFALMPVPGDVDIVLASELMEAGRALLRGLITPEKTTFIASDHRAYTIAEKSAMTDGRIDSVQLLKEITTIAPDFVHFDMEALAKQHGSAISAVMFGALFASAALPMFSRAQFCATIERSGVGVANSLKAFDAAVETLQHGDLAALDTPALDEEATRPVAKDPDIQALIEQIYDEFPSQLNEVLITGIRRLVAYQDPEYGALYLQRLHKIKCLDDASDKRLLLAVARHLAVWMSYEDTVRVAEIKISQSRHARIRQEINAEAEHIIEINEFLHPRLEEICDTLPKAWGEWLSTTSWARSLVGLFVRTGRQINSHSILGFSLLYGLASLRKWRRASRRYHEENQQIESWLYYICRVKNDLSYDAALEIALTQGLIKGYSDTHKRGLRNFNTIMTAVKGHLPVIDGAMLARLRQAASQDEHGLALSQTLKTLNLL